MYNNFIFQKQGLHLELHISKIFLNIAFKKEQFEKTTRATIQREKAD